jgi:cytoskeletal protein RodZ
MRKPLSQEHRGMALIIVLAFVVLLMGLTIAYFSQTTADRQTAHTSFNQSNADQIASSGVAMILGDLRQEIINGSASPAPSFAPSPAGTPCYAYLPTSAANMVPKRSGTPSAGAAIPNLVRRSVRNDSTSMPSPGFPSRASAVNSVTDPSANGRAVTLPRWNKHYLIPKLVTTGGDASTDPVTSFLPPDWVMVTAEEGAAVLSNPTTDSSSTVVTPIGRYAYAIYDIGGLLDINVAGYPTNSTASQIGRKGSLGYADLTILPYPIPNPSQLDQIIGWRNYATTQPSNNFPDTTFAANFQTSSTAATNFYKYIVSNSNGFLGPNPTAALYNNRTDQAFVNRQQLIAFRAALGFSSNALQHLTTFSRQPTAPSWSPSTPTSTNPDFRTLRVTSSFTRNDGTIAARGEPLVKKRFSLQRLNWLTYKGPSAYRDGIANNRALDSDLAILTANYGVDTTYLQKGTDLTQATATTANIYNYFGLVWDATNERYKYIGHPDSPTATSPLATSIATLGTLTGSREPDFFELLQAGILDSSLGVSVASDAALPIAHQQSKMLHILTIGANLISQARTDSYPVRIAFDSGGGIVMEAVGSTRIPYLNSLAACAIATTSGGLNWIVVPNLWDPYRNNWDLLEASPVPAYPRPAVRIRAIGAVSFATVAAATATPTPIPTPTPTPTPTATPTPTP